MRKVTIVARGATKLTVIDFSGCEPGTFTPIIEDAQLAICGQPLGAVRAVTVFDEDVRFDMATVKEMQRFASKVMPHLRSNALVGIQGMKKVVFNGIKPLYKVPVELFDDLEAAEEWAAAS